VQRDDFQIEHHFFTPQTYNRLTPMNKKPLSDAEFQQLMVLITLLPVTLLSLANGFRFWAFFAAIPGILFCIWREARKRKQQKQQSLDSVVEK
jgi:hypothetical protein